MSDFIKIIKEVSDQMGYSDLKLKFDNEKTVGDMIESNIWCGQIMLTADEISYLSTGSRQFDCIYFFDLSGNIRGNFKDDNSSYDHAPVTDKKSKFLLSSFVGLSLEQNIFYDDQGAYLNSTKRMSYQEQEKDGIIEFLSEDKLILKEFNTLFFNSRVILNLRQDINLELGLENNLEENLDVSPNQ